MKAIENIQKEWLKQLSNNELFRIALRMTKNRQAAEDLLQDVHYQVLKKQYLFQTGTNFRAWVITIMRNLFINNCRRDQRRQELLSLHCRDLRWGTDQSVFNYAEGNLNAAAIMQQVTSLPIIYREAFLLYYQGYKYHEIAQKMGTPVGTTKSRVFVARTMLRKQLEALKVRA